MDMKYLATILFACAVLHTFLCKKLLSFAHRYPEGSMQENLFHFLGEVEVVFGLWAAVFIGVWSLRFGTGSAAEYLSTINYTEAAFVFVVMCMSATRPVLMISEKFIELIARALPLPKRLALFISYLSVGPLLGSLITEPAAMTVTALLLRDQFFKSKISSRLKYLTLGLLFVNVSIGGTLTHFAAPPVLMVAGPWGWDTPFMFTHFGWRAALSVILGTGVLAFIFRKEILDSKPNGIDNSGKQKIPFWVVGVHLAFLAITIVNAHYIAFIIGIFLFFLGWCTVSNEYQDEIKIKESLLVGFFLAGLVTLGKLQGWWLEPLVSSLGETPLFWGALSLTAVTDNAALTYLGTLVPDLSDGAKYALVSGAVAGGGLTVIANAPNPAGYGLLRESFGADGVSPMGLFLGALPFTLLAAVAFLL